METVHAPNVVAAVVCFSFISSIFIRFAERQRNAYTCGATAIKMSGQGV